MVWGMIVAPRGTSAWRALLSAMLRPREPKMAAIVSTMASSRSSGTFITAAMASRVMSSWVGPEPTAHDHPVGAGQRGAQRQDDAGLVVAHRLVEVGVDAGGGELLADPGGVGVGDLAEEQLGPDGDDLDPHPARLRWRRARAPAVDDVLHAGDEGERHRHPHRRW